MDMDLNNRHGQTIEDGGVEHMWFFSLDKK
jgi:hypothetical protein